ncbi:MAG: HIT family protein [Sphaerochaetaceae bacterium]|jgi:histidine triad (HIT) family protein
MGKTVFSRIIDGEIPSVKLHEDDQCIVILDISPVEKGHALIIAKHPYPTFSECPASTLSHMMEIAKKVDEMQRNVLGCDGTNVIINNGKASGQEVPHLHIHVIPRFLNDGQSFKFAKQTYAEGEMNELGGKLSF